MCMSKWKLFSVSMGFLSGRNHPAHRTHPSNPCPYGTYWCTPRRRFQIWRPPKKGIAAPQTSIALCLSAAIPSGGGFLSCLPERENGDCSPAGFCPPTLSDIFQQKQKISKSIHLVLCDSQTGAFLLRCYLIYSLSILVTISLTMPGFALPLDAFMH